MDILIGTSNMGKLNEYRALLAAVPARLLNLRDVGLANLEVDETGATLEANARLKALAYAGASGLLTLADDTGLEIDALGGAPGIYPARYGGPGLTMAQRRAKVLAELAGVPDEQRTARFICAIVAADPRSSAVMAVEGRCEGQIVQTEAPSEHGFGYDAIFIPQGYAMPWSLIPMAEKNPISHRGRAAAQIIPWLQARLG
jgi:XTP/dITP diphosphohydrolase